MRSTEEMQRAVQSKFVGCTIAIFAAAVADYRPAEKSGQKIKHGEAGLTLRLEPNPDILGDTVAKEKASAWLSGLRQRPNMWRKTPARSWGRRMPT